MKYCNRCNSYNDDSANYCSNCAAPLNEQSTHQAEFENQNQSQRTDYNQYQQYQNSQQYQNQYQYQNNGQYQNPNYQNYGNYQNVYGQPMPAQSNTLAIVATVIAVLTGNILGIIFGVLAIVKFNDYERLNRFGNFADAQIMAKKSKNNAIISIVFSACGLILIPIILFIGFSIFRMVPTDIETIYGFEEGINILISLI